MPRAARTDTRFQRDASKRAVGLGRRGHRAAPPTPAGKHVDRFQPSPVCASRSSDISRRRLTTTGCRQIQYVSQRQASLSMKDKRPSDRLLATSGHWRTVDAAVSASESTWEQTFQKELANQLRISQQLRPFHISGDGMSHGSSCGCTYLGASGVLTRSSSKECPESWHVVMESMVAERWLAAVASPAEAEASSDLGAF